MLKIDYKAAITSFAVHHLEIKHLVYEKTDKKGTTTQYLHVFFKLDSSRAKGIAANMELREWQRSGFVSDMLRDWIAGYSLPCENIPEGVEILGRKKTAEKTVHEVHSVLDIF